MPGTVRLIAAKELLDTLRDRRTLFVALVLPLLLYPALLLGLTQVIGATQRNLERESQRILVSGLAPEGELTALLLEQDLQPEHLSTADGDLLVALQRLSGALATDESESATESEGDRDRLRADLDALLIREGVVGAVLCRDASPRAEQELKSAVVSMLFNVTNDESRVARGKTIQALRGFAKARRVRLKEASPADLRPLEYMERPVIRSEVEIASKEQKGAKSFAPLLGLLIVIMCLTGAFYPAVDLAAGEKERGTMETLLVAPVPRSEMVIGKFLAVWVVAVVTALLNLIIMALTFSKLAGMFPAGQIAFHLPLGAFLAVTLILIPTAALFSAVALAISAFATSYKEGQHYLTPLFLVVMPLAMVALLPKVELGAKLALVPVANVVLLVKAMLVGGEGVRHAALATAAMALYALIALRVAIVLFKRESVLFRGGAGKSYDRQSLAAKRAGLPTEGRAILLFFTVVALMFFLAGKVPENLAGAVRVFFMSQVVAILLPTILFARLSKVRIRAAFSLKPLPPIWIPVILLAALSTLICVLGFYRFVMPKPDSAQGFQKVVGMLADAPVWLTLLLLAVLPPICEEFLCRGYLLSAFKARRGAARAVVMSALLFGILHLDIHRLPGTFLVGLMLGAVLVRTGSLLATILFHAVYNGVIALTLHYGWLAVRLETLSPGAYALAAFGLVASAYALWYLRLRRLP